MAGIPIGSIYGRLYVESLDKTVKYPTQTKIYYRCKCSCGDNKIVRGDHLRSGKIQSCGCLHDESASTRKTTHGQSKSRAYRIWSGMKLRSDDSYISHHSYIGVGRDSSWDSFENFYRDMGEPPTPLHTLDRIDPFGDYSSSNCRWATRKEQAENRRANHEISKLFFDLQPIVNRRVFVRRVRSGWDPYKAARSPKMKNQFR